MAELNPQDPGYKMTRFAEDVALLTLPRPINEYAAIQAAYETAVKGVPFKSNVLKQNNNYFNVKYFGQKAATPGTSASADGGGRFAKYTSRNAMMTDMKNILSKAPGYPIKATSMADYVRRLKMNKFFTAPEAQYLKGMEAMKAKYWEGGLRNEIALQERVKEAAQKEGNYYKQKANEAENGFKMPKLGFGAWIGIGLAAGLIFNR